jgi:hypothetical protein
MWDPTSGPNVDAVLYRLENRILVSIGNFSKTILLFASKFKYIQKQLLRNIIENLDQLGITVLQGIIYSFQNQPIAIFTFAVIFNYEIKIANVLRFNSIKRRSYFFG